MTRSEFPIPRDAATEDHAALLAFIRKAAEASGAFTVYAGEPGFTPSRISFTTRQRPRVDTLAQVLRARAASDAPAGGTPSLFLEPAPPRPPSENWMRDLPGLYIHLLFAVDLERRLFIAGNPLDHQTPDTFANRTIAARHVDRILETGWHVWEHDRDDEEDRVEILVGFTAPNFLRYVDFERDAFAEEAGHRHALAERPWSPDGSPASASTHRLPLR